MTKFRLAVFIVVTFLAMGKHYCRASLRVDIDPGKKFVESGRKQKPEGCSATFFARNAIFKIF